MHDSTYEERPAEEIFSPRFLPASSQEVIGSISSLRVTQTYQKVINLDSMIHKTVKYQN